MDKQETNVCNYAIADRDFAKTEKCIKKKRNLNNFRKQNKFDKFTEMKLNLQSLTRVF